MTIFGLDNVASRGGQTATTASDGMGKNDFLRLLVVQLQAQDPLNPMDATAFTAQLAQFSSLEQLQNMNSTLTGIGTSQTVLTNSQAVGFIGKNVTAVGDRIQVTQGRSEPLHFSLREDSSGVYVKIYDAEGNFIRNIDCGGMAVGQQSVNWDGRNTLGNTVPDGGYHFEVKAVNQNNQPVQTVTFTQGTVSGVNYKDGRAYLITEGQEIPLGNIVKVMDEL
jgi:flagellar basal-body rod modification protein FlgD